METYTALLRGINVSGQKKVPMKELKGFFEEEGFEKVTTYIQSGNIVFSARKSTPEKLVKQIEKLIKDRYSFEADTFILIPGDLKDIVANNPFTQDKGYDDARLYVTRLADLPEAERLKKLNEVSYPPEEFVVKGKTIYFYSPNGYGNAKMDNNFFESKLKVRATTRNWKTINTLIELAGKQ